MMPSAKIAARDSPPPANRSYRENSVPCERCAYSASACTLTPGVAMWAPMRYTSRARSVKRILSLSSGTLNRLGFLGAVTRSPFDGAARLLDLRPGGGGRRDPADDELPGHLAHAEQLDRAVGPAHESRAEQRVGGDFDTFGEQRQMPDVHDLRRIPEGIGEAALGDAADERHLPALEPQAGRAAGAGLVALLAAAAGLPDPRARPPAHADARAVGAPRRLERVQGQMRSSGGALCPLLLLCRSHRPLSLLHRRHLGQVAH